MTTNKSSRARRVLTGRATPDGTARYAKRIAQRYPEYQPELAVRWIAAQQWAVSRLAFGTYRVAAGFDDHFDALREALLIGTNVIDTAHEYGNGAAEALVGEVLEQMMDAGRTKRDEIVIISKAGLIQGRELAALRRREFAFRETEEVRDDLVHCLHPAFFRRQLLESLRRMRLDCIDVFLVNNPEYQLQAAERRGEPRAAALARHEQRLEALFADLERCCDEGLIQCYGVSSAGFFLDDYSALPLDAYLRLAGPRFRVVQYRANLCESDFRSEQRRLCEPAAAENLWRLAVRPLNARGPNGLIRLARIAAPPPDDGAATIAEMNRLLDSVQESESLLLVALGERHFAFDTRAPAASDVVRLNRDRFVSLSHLDGALPDLRALIQRAINRITPITEGDARSRYILEQYVIRINALLSLWRRYAALIHHHRMQDLEEELASCSPALADRPLALQALLTLLADPCVDTVAVGMRRRSYVRMLSEAYAAPLPVQEDLDVLIEAAASFVAGLPSTATAGAPVAPV